MADFTSPFSSFGGGVMGFLGMERQNYHNAKQAQEQMDFQRDMSSTAHQREVADLRAAGLNPLLSVNRGASSPGGAMAVMGDSAAAALRGASSAQDLKRQRAEIDNLHETNELIREQAKQSVSQRALNNALTATSHEDAVLRHRQALTQEHMTTEAMWNAKIAGEAFQGALTEGNIDRSEAGQTLRLIQRFIPSFNSATGAARFRVR